MARIAPFQGLRYPHRDGDPLLAPPYDVVDEADAARLRAKNPHNIAHLLLTDKNNPHTYEEKGALLKDWLARGVLVEDAVPSLYVLRQTFEDRDQSGTVRPVTRWALTCCVGIEEYEARVVLPHEKTLSGPKTDRLNLMSATCANFSQVMGLYEGGGGLLGDFQALTAKPADTVYHDDGGVVNEMWVVSDPAFIKKAVDLLADKQILIADGHHRYETSRQFRDKAPELGLGEGAGWMTFSLIDGQDEGVVVYPIHRWVSAEALAQNPGWEEKMTALFDVDTLPALPPDAHRALRGYEDQQGAATFVLVRRGQNPQRLTLKAEVLAELASVPDHLRGLDTAVLQGAFFHDVLGLDAQDIAQEKGVGYLKDFTALDNLLARPEVGAVLLCRPTPLPLVMQLAREGVVLPQKSTFFYPKLPSGMTMRRIR